MGKWLIGVVVALLGCLAWAGAVRPQGVNEPPKIQGAVVGDRIAYVVLPPEVICGPRVEWVTPSDSGSYALIDRRILPDAFSRSSAPPEMNLLLWDATARRSVVVWRETLSGQSSTSAGAERLGSVAYWFHDLPVALVALGAEDLVDVSDPEDVARKPKSLPIRYLLVNAGKRTARVLFTGTAQDQVIPNERLPLVAFKSHDENTFRIVDAEGKVVRTVNAPPPSKTFFWLEWLTDDRTLLGIDIVVSPENPGKRERVFCLLDTETGKVTRQSTDPRVDAPKTSGPVRLPFEMSYGKGQMQNLNEPKRTIPLKALWVVGNDKETHGRVLVTIEGERVDLSANAVYYHSNGTLFAAPIVRLPIADYLALEKARTMQRAKQVGLGLMMYSQDYDDVLPPPNGDIAEMVAPYLLDNSLMSGFSPLYKNPSQVGLPKPAETPIGSITGPGGQAIIYADGHVVWKSDK